MCNVWKCRGLDDSFLNGKNVKIHTKTLTVEMLKWKNS